MLKSSELLVRTSLSPSVYNHLSTLGDVDEFVRARGLIDTMQRSVGELFIRHRVNASWAIYLLHQHWNIEDGEIPGEVVHNDGDSLGYLMRPIEKTAPGYVPSLLGIRNGSFQALEFSSAPHAIAAYEILMNNKEFLPELMDALERNGLQECFGVGVARNISRPDRQWVEFSQNDRGSWMKEVPIGQISDRELVQTSWIFQQPERSEGFCWFVNHPAPPVCWKHTNCYSPAGSHNDPQARIQ